MGSDKDEKIVPRKVADVMVEFRMSHDGSKAFRLTSSASLESVIANLRLKETESNWGNSHDKIVWVKAAGSARSAFDRLCSDIENHATTAAARGEAVPKVTPPAQAVR